jgi:hypothetical protein
MQVEFWCGNGLESVHLEDEERNKRIILKWISGMFG